MNESYEDDQIDEFADIVGALVAGGKSLTTVRSMLRQLKTPLELIELAVARHELRMFNISGVAVLVDRGSDHTPWYPGPQAGDRFWPPVRLALEATLPADAVHDIDMVTSLTLSKLRPAGTPAFSTRGLVVGYVQSGKTTNFIALAAKAADAGYKLIVVLSGVTDILRNQTQQRVDEVLVGGSLDWLRLTKDNADFAETGDAAPLFVQFNGALVAVVKKNPGRLTRLRDWLKSAGSVAMQHAPMLLIDDEADQASIDVGDAERASKINNLLRQILQHPRSAYIAYTATPFANLLIDPQTEDDLYPRDFIVSMPRPGGYFGAEELFGGIDDPDASGLDAIRTIPAAEATSAKPPTGVGAVNTWTPLVGSELRRALMWFVLSTAAKRIRHGDVTHSTMLVHTSMLSEAHFRMRDAIAEVMRHIGVGIATDSADVLEELHELYESECARVAAASFGNLPVSWELLRPSLRAVTEDVDVVVDNYKSTDRLRYEKDEPTTAVVIGGNTLSRGLTLEGLTASYFVRSASAYDTLLQMGRWFGYRLGYEDLCRIWMTDELKGWFRDLSGVEQEIREEISRYAREGLTPLELGVRIRLHPHLAITAAAKMRKAIAASLSYGGRSPQTTLFRRTDSDRLASNLSAVRTLLTDALRAGGEPTQFRSGSALTGIQWGLVDVPAEFVLRFLDSYEFDDGQRGISGQLLNEYIRDELQCDSLRTWRIVIMGGPSGEPLELPGFGAVKSVIRSRLKSADDDGVANIRALMSAEDRIAGVEWTDGEVPPKGVDLQIERSTRHPNEGILRIYPIDRTSEPKSGQTARVALDASDVVIGIAVDFPASVAPEPAIGYMIANVPGADDLEEREDSSAADSADEENLDA